MLSYLPVSSNDPTPIRPVLKWVSTAVIIGSGLSSKKTSIDPVSTLRTSRTLCHFSSHFVPAVRVFAIETRGSPLTRNIEFAWASDALAMCT